MQQISVTAGFDSFRGLVAEVESRQRTVGRLTISMVRGYFSHMKQAKVSDLKNQLSRYLDYVRNGETVLVLDRNIPVAELRPVSEKISNGRIAALERKGIIRRGSGRLPTGFLKKIPAGKPAGVLAALLDEREKGR